MDKVLITSATPIFGRNTPAVGTQGLSYYLPQHHGTLSATWFDTQYHDLIVYDFSVFPGTTVNVDQARTRGVELSA